MVGVLRKEVKAIAKNLPIEYVKSLSQQVRETLIRERMMATLASLFCLLALVLTCVDLYGLVAYGTGRRVNEIGIRVVLGARRRVRMAVGVHERWMSQLESQLHIPITLVVGA
jgi:hypothetical protein